jgi:dTDP-4-amino-4,6-dideoxygalactose transaminase
LPFLNAYKQFGYTQADFPVSFEATKHILSIPMFPELTQQQMDVVITALNNFNA